MYHVDGVPSNIPIVCSNINATGDQYLGGPRPGVSYQSRSGMVYESWHVLDVPINGNNSQTVSVGFVGCAYEWSNRQAALGDSVRVASAPEGLVRQAIQLLQHSYPSVNIIVLLSSCSPDVNEHLARNIIEIDIIIEANSQLYSNTEPAASGVVSKYPKVIKNIVQSPVLFMSAGTNGGRFGHLAVQFDRKGQLLNWFGDAYTLNTTYAADPAMTTRVSTLLDATSAFESQVIGRITHTIEGDDCKATDCAMGQFTTDAMLWYCPDCDVAMLNGGYYGFPGNWATLTYKNGGNITIKDLYQIDQFGNTHATFFITGQILFLALQTCVKVFGLLQVSGLRYAYNPDTSLPIENRLIDVEIWNKFSQAYVPLVLSQSYKIASSDYMVLYNGNYATVLLPNAQQFNRYGPLLREVYHKYIRAMGVIDKLSTSKKNLAPCSNTTYVLASDKGKTVWPNPTCRIVKVSGSEDLSKRCPTNPNIAYGTEVYPGMIAGVTSINSTMTACSGLGICFQQQCTCALATQGLYAGFEMIKGTDCSQIRREYKLSSGVSSVLYILSALVIGLSVLTSLFYILHRDAKVVRASSPWFMHVACCGTMLAAISVIITLQSPTDQTCSAQYWALACGFGATFGALFAKTYRLYAIFNQREIRLVSISNWQVLSIVMGVVSVELLILIVFQAYSPLRVSGTVMDTELSWGFRMTCSSPQGPSFAAALLAFNCLIILVGTLLSWELRHIEGTFNETKYLGMAIYNTSIIAIVVLPLVYVFAGTYPTFITAFSSIFILYCAAFVLLIVTIPKYMSIRRMATKAGSKGKGANRRASGTIANGQGNVSKFSNSSASGHGSGSSQEFKIPNIYVASRQFILQDLMVDESSPAKLHRLERHLAHAQSHIAELQRLCTDLKSHKSPTHQPQQQTHKPNRASISIEMERGGSVNAPGEITRPRASVTGAGCGAGYGSEHSTHQAVLVPPGAGNIRSSVSTSSLALALPRARHDSLDYPVDVHVAGGVAPEDVLADIPATSLQPEPANKHFI